MSGQSFGEKVRFYRTLRGWDQNELAERIGKSVATISRIENGAQEVTLRVILALSTALEVEIKDLIDGKEILTLPPEDNEILVALMRSSRRLPQPLLKRLLALCESVEASLSAREDRVIPPAPV